MKKLLSVLLKQYRFKKGVLLKLCSVALSFVLVFSSVAALSYQALAASGDTIGQYDFTITNPYKSINWDTWKAYKAATHVHTVRSDGDIELNEMIEKYYSLGYQALALTDHGTVNYSWTKDQKRLAIYGYQFAKHGNVDELTEERYQQITTGSDRGGDGMTEVPLGIELNGASTVKCHVNSYYADCGHGDLELTSKWPEDAVKKSQAAGGICHINHVGEWTEGRNDINTYNAEFVSKFASIFLNYSACVGMELVNTTDNRTHNDRYLYDETLKITAPQGRNIWGFCEDDAHDFGDVENNAQYFVMPENTQANIRTSMENGTFFACSKTSKNDWELGDGFEAEGPFPMVSRVTVDDDTNQISINPYNAHTVKIVADGNVIGEKSVANDNDTITFDLNDYENQINSYVRIYILGKGGICYVQPFLVTKTEYTKCTVQFNIPYDGTTFTFKDAQGNIVEPINDQNYFRVLAGNYSYSVAKEGFETKTGTVNVSQATVDAGLQIKVDIELIKNSGPLSFTKQNDLIYGFNILKDITEPVNQSIGLKNNTHFDIDDSSKAKTGDEIRVVDDKTGNVLKTYTIVVFGDVNGDGIYDGRDATVISMIINGMITPSASMRLAADCNHDNVITAKDLAIVEQAGLLLSTVSQNESIQTSSVFDEYSSIILQSIPEEQTEEEEKSKPTEEKKQISFFRKLYETIVSFFGYLFGIL